MAPLIFDVDDLPFDVVIIFIDKYSIILFLLPNPPINI